MRGCVPWIVIVVVAAHSGDAAAQFFGPDPSVRAELYRVSGGELDSGAGSGADDRNAEGRVCLNTGTYIFAVEAHGEFAGLGVWQAGKMNPSPPEPEQPWNAPTTSLLIDARGDRPGWSWTSFGVHRPQCYDFRVSGGRTRLYQLGVGVTW